MIPGQAQQFFEGAAGGAGGDFQIDRSLRFNRDDSAYLSRTPSSAGNRKTWTWSGWVKRSNFFLHSIFAAYDSSNTRDVLMFKSQKLTLEIGTSGTFRTEKTLAILRDTSAWYHIVAAFDSTQSTAADRLKLYVNGVEQSVTGTPVDQNTQSTINNADVHYIGASSISGSAGSFFDGYMAEVNFVDGTQLAASDFGEYDSNNVWQPKEYSGSYGTNGFYLKFADNSSNAALGTDSSGNNNTWTVNNLSIGGQAYSSGVTTSIDSSYPATNAFDGSQSTHTRTSGTGVVLNVNFNPGIAVTSSVEIQGEQGYITPNCSITVDGTTTTAGGDPNTAVAGTAGTTTKTFSGVSGTLTNLKVGKIASGRTYLSRILIDGVALVDGNPSNTDSLIDTPTNYTAASGNNGGNYCTWNRLCSNFSSTLSNGNLQSQANSVGGNTFGTIKMPSSGKYYWECEITDEGSKAVAGFGLSVPFYTGNYIVSVVGIWYVASTGNISYNSTQVSYGATFGENDIIGIAVDCDNNTIEFFKNGTSQGVGSPSTYNLNVTDYVPAAGDSSGNFNNTIVGNFGQRPFAYTPPTGYVSLCTTNLPEPTIADGSTAFNTSIWNGNSTQDRKISTAFSPDFVWVKRRNSAKQHILVDKLRGDDNYLHSNATNANQVLANLLGLVSDGYELGVVESVNATNNSYVGWAWDAGSSTVSNTDGSITSSVRANPSAGFSIVSYDGSASSGRFTVGHGLNAAPAFVITKSRNTASAWGVYTTVLGNNSNWFTLNTTDAVGSGTDFVYLQNSVLDIKFDSFAALSSSMIAYCFAPVEGFSAIGSYQGNGSADGPFVYTGFRNKFLLIRKTDGQGGDWRIFDTERDPHNVATKNLFGNLTDAEGGSSSITGFDIVSNGFKLRASHSALNSSGSTYIYLAFAEHPFKTARAR